MRGERLPYAVFSASNALYNPNTGFDMVYQENKVFNLKVLAKKLDGLMVQSGETFSFWRVAKGADKHTPYREGLVLRGGKLVVAPAGGLCQMSNLLFWVFLHSPLDIVERHTHRVKTFTTPEGMPEGVDATISEGWLDLKLTNNTDFAFQIGIDFDETTITCTLYADKQLLTEYEIESRDAAYVRRGDVTYQEANIYRNGELLYKNICQMGFEHEEA